ncbi:MAG: hypothetical protein K2N47_04235, partial [Clostridia bacterium]|nr:hypothetical protein [Clostridia bacterium]
MKKCVKIISAFIVCLIFFLFHLIFFNPVAAFADGAPSYGTVKAGIFGFEGYHMKDDDGRLTGYGIEFLNLVSEYSHLKFEYTGYDKTWDNMLDM